ncbi:LuxR C-terminal-related transcriptional regulator [Streptomyces sp. NPDC050856]|uniref:helix-turn-helix transcriptional regulator n=1 Tax=Streptomyces sp. NPDC050856 TaxID=3154939 RepID=UPI0034098854
MPYLRGDDYERMLDLAVGVLETRQPDQVWQLIAQELLRALRGTVVVTKDMEWTPASGLVGVWHPDAARPAVPEDWTARHIRAGYPFAAHYRAGADRLPRTAAQLAGARAWRHSEVASAMRESFGTRHVLAVPLPDAGGTVRGFVVHRAGEDFGDADRLYATRVQPLLAAAAAQYDLLARRQRGARAARAQDRVARSASCGLTPRETAVLLTLAEGLPATGMARRLGVSVRTVHKHLQNLYRKLDTVDRLSTVLRAQELGLL